MGVLRVIKTSSPKPHGTVFECPLESICLLHKLFCDSMLESSGKEGNDHKTRLMAPPDALSALIGCAS